MIDAKAIGETVAYKLSPDDFVKIPTGYRKWAWIASLYFWLVYVSQDFLALVYRPGNMLPASDASFAFKAYFWIHVFGVYLTTGLFALGFACWLLWLIGTWWFYRKILVRTYKTNAMLQGEGRLALTEDGVMFVWPDWHCFVKWLYVYRWVETKSHIFLYVSAYYTYIIPKRIETMGFPLMQCREMLLNNVGKPKQVTLRKKQEK